MKNKPFNKPRISLNRSYTRGGDAGKTSLAGGQRVWKDSVRINCCGVVDELNALIGLACISSRDLSEREPKLGDLALILNRIQHELFNLGSILATQAEDIHPKQARVTGDEVEQLEREIDSANENLPTLSSFELPGGSRLSAELHVCRTVCRRAERIVITLSKQDDISSDAIRYLNRLSDAFFVWSRWVNHLLNVPAVLWDPNRTAPDQ